MKIRDWTVMFLVVATMAAPAIVVGAAVQEKNDKSECASNLRSLWQCQYIYLAQYGGMKKLFPLETGPEFWLKLSKTPKPIIEKQEVFYCPVAKEAMSENWDWTSYRGPATNVNLYGDKDLVGADRATNHGAGNGGNILFKNGDVKEVTAKDPQWIQAGLKTTGSHEDSALQAVNMLLTAETDFRAKDLDGNGVADYWTGDVHALFAMCPLIGKGVDPKPDPAKAIKLIHEGIADADAAPISNPVLGKVPPGKPVPWHGYLFAALRKDSKGDYHKGDYLCADRFGFIAYPETYGKSGKLTYLVNQAGEIYSKDTTEKVPDAFPEKPLEAGWTKVK